MKLCVFQGTFNPIHKAHIRLVEFVKNKYNFDKILVIPAADPPHKDFDPLISVHRLNMVKLVFESMDGVEVSDIEYNRTGKSYTYLTICELYDKFEISGKINFIIGTDAFQNIEKWYEAEKLKKIVKFIVFKREADFTKNKYDYLKNKGYDFKFEDLSFEDISSSELRRMIKQKEVTNDYILEEVKDYIERYELYKN